MRAPIATWVAALIGAIVAPTDAALGASIMQDEVWNYSRKHSRRGLLT